MQANRKSGRSVSVTSQKDTPWSQLRRVQRGHPKLEPKSVKTCMGGREVGVGKGREAKGKREKEQGGGNGGEWRGSGSLCLCLCLCVWVGDWCASVGGGGGKR